MIILSEPVSVLPDPHHFGVAYAQFLTAILLIVTASALMFACVSQWIRARVTTGQQRRPQPIYQQRDCLASFNRVTR